MHRNQRLTAIVRVLRASDRTSAEQLAHHFAVSPRTIYRDIALLHRMGVQVVGEPGFGYRLDPTVASGGLEFTADEIQALFECARKGLALADPGTADALVRAMRKVQQVLPDVLVEAMRAGPLFLEPTPDEEA